MWPFKPYSLRFWAFVLLWVMFVGKLSTSCSHGVDCVPMVWIEMQKLPGFYAREPTQGDEEKNLKRVDSGLPGDGTHASVLFKVVVLLIFNCRFESIVSKYSVRGYSENTLPNLNGFSS